MTENSRSEKLHEIVACQKLSAQEQFVKFSGEWNAQVGQLFHERLSEWVGQIEAFLSRELDEAVASAQYKSRRAANEELNQITRRLRQCQSAEEVAAWLVDSTPSFCGQAALFGVIGTRVRAVRARGFPMAGTETPEVLETPLDRAPAFAHCIQERDIVVAIGSPAEFSPEVVAALAQASAEKVHLYPIVIEEKVAAILYTTAGSGPPVDGAALELLAHAAASALRTLSPPGPGAARNTAGAGLITIEGVAMQTPKARVAAILRQALEARARWFARAEAGRMRLLQKPALEQGRLQRNIYSALKPQIDAARRRYKQDFIAVSPAIADYLHKELLALAHDDASLLGAEYPGSLV